MPDDATFIRKKHGYLVQSWLNRTELILREDSEDDLTEDDSVTFKEYFGESDDELNKSFYGFEEEYEVMEEDSTDNSAFLKYILSLPN